MVRQGRREEAGTLLQHLRQVSAGRGPGEGVRPRERPAPSRESRGGQGHRPGPPSARMEPCLVAGASALPLNLGPRGRAEKAWPGEAHGRGPVGLMSLLLSSARLRGWSVGGERGCAPGLGQRSYFLMCSQQVALTTRGPQGMHSYLLSLDSRGAGEGGVQGRVLKGG